LRLSLRTLLPLPIVLALGGALAAAPTAFAANQSAAQSAPAPQKLACNLEVCETLIALPPPILRVQGTARPPSSRCGRFVMTVIGPPRSFTAVSPLVCGLRPAYTFNVVGGALRPGTTIAMQFMSNPPTPGEPILRV
jgi:hypothetical protein